MKLNILAFGIAKDIIGASAVELEVASEATVANLKTTLEVQYPPLKQLTSYMIAVNNEYAGAENTLQHRDEVAIIPPVSGG